MPLLERPAGEDAWLGVALVPAPGVRRLEVGGRAALFCEQTGRLAELNPTAERIWRGLAGGRAPSAVADELFRSGASRDQASGFVAEAARAWLQVGWLRLPRPTEPLSRLPLRVGRLAVELAVSAGDPVEAELAAVFGRFAEAGGRAGATVEVRRFADGYLLGLEDVARGFFAGDRIVPEVKALLTERLASSGALLLHGALLGRAGRGLMITGVPGAGKTTLAVALAASGFGYGSDDIVEVAANGRLAGVPFSPAVKAGAWDLLAAYAPGLARRPVHRRADGLAVRYLPAEWFAAGTALELGWALTLDRRLGAAATLERLEPLAMLAEVLGGAFAGDRACGAQVEALAAQLSAADCRRLVYDDLDLAVAAIRTWTDG